MVFVGSFVAAVAGVALFVYLSVRSKGSADPVAPRLRGNGGYQPVPPTSPTTLPLPPRKHVVEMMIEADVRQALATLTDATILAEVSDERRRQDTKWGEQNHPDLSPETSTSTVERAAGDMGVPSAHVARQRVENLAKRGALGYADIALEEFAEAIEAAALSDTDALRKELVQTAAVLVAWVGCIDRRASRNTTEG